MIEDSAKAKSDALEIVREIIRRAGHEIRNALSGVAVNVGGGEKPSLRAADGADALSALCGPRRDSRSGRTAR